jgi:hypothetical protein
MDNIAWKIVDYSTKGLEWEKQKICNSCLKANELQAWHTRKTANLNKFYLTKMRRKVAIKKSCVNLKERIDSRLDPGSDCP